MSDEKPKVLRDVKLLWWGPDPNGLGEILSVKESGSAGAPPGGVEEGPGAEADEQAREHGEPI